MYNFNKNFLTFSILIIVCQSICISRWMHNTISSKFIPVRAVSSLSSLSITSRTTLLFVSKFSSFFHPIPNNQSFSFSYKSHPFSTLPSPTQPLPGILPRRSKKTMQKVYELCITNAGIYVKNNVVFRILQENNINFLEVDKRPNDIAAFVRFGSVEALNEAYRIIPTIKHKDRLWTVGSVTGNRMKRTDDEIESRIRKYYNQHFNPQYQQSFGAKKAQSQTSNNASQPSGKRRPMYNEEGQLISISSSTNDNSSSSNSSTMVLNSLLPWHNVPYEEQLQRKQRDMDEVMRTITDKIILNAQRNVDKKSSNNNKNKHSSPHQQHKRKWETLNNETTNSNNNNDSTASTSSITELSTTSTSSSLSTTTSYSSVLLEYLPFWFKNSNIQSKDLCCPLYPILPAPEPKHYRNKAQYTIGYNEQHQPCVGFLSGSFENTAGVVVNANQIAFNIPDNIHKIADKVQQFVETSPFKPYDTFVHGGVWRQVTIRWARHGLDNKDEYMIDLLTTPPGSSSASEITENFEANKNKNMDEFLRKYALLIKEDIERKQAEASITTATNPKVTHEPNEEVKESTTSLSSTTASVVTETNSSVELSTSSLPSPTDNSSNMNIESSKPEIDEEELKRQLDVYKEELQRFVTFMLSNNINITSIYLQEYSGLSCPSPNHPHILLHGNEYIREQLCELSFDISPGAFFQVNTPVAEKLYYLARTLALEGIIGADQMLLPSSLSSSSLTIPVSQFHYVAPTKRTNVGVIDVCCGTGTIGLICSAYVGKVIGVELSQEAINDAIRNTKLNNISNTEFICNKAEMVMRDILNIIQGKSANMTKEKSSSTNNIPTNTSTDSSIEEVIAIVDPPRNGLHVDVIKSLRTCKAIQRIIYVSCNPSGSLIEDAVKLCIPQEDTNNTAARGPEFQPILALPVDMFPYTPHCEMVMVFERVQNHLRKNI